MAIVSIIWVYRVIGHHELLVNNRTKIVLESILGMNL